MRKKVLVVDNNKVIVRLLTNFLEARGYETATAEDGLTALEVLESFRPSVVFVDLIMPKINGQTLCRIIRKMPEYDATFLVVISAIAAEEQIDFRSFGADACVAKGPFKEMAAHLDTILDHLQKNEIGLLADKIFGKENLFERDITKELLAIKKHFETTLDNMGDGFLELTAEGNIIFANPAAVTLLGQTEEKILSSYLPDFFQGRHRDLVYEVLQWQEQDIVEIGEEESLVLHDKCLLLKLVPVTDQEQKFVIVLINDITTRKQVEMELRRHKENLEEMVQERTVALEEKNAELEEALTQVKTLSGLLPICASCKKIRDDKGYWNQIETYISDHAGVDFSHSICPQCAKKLYPDFDLFMDQDGNGNKEKGGGDL